MDKLANAGSVGERYQNAYWLKEHALRRMRARIGEVRKAEPSRAAALDALDKDLVRLYYTGQFPAYVTRIADVPGR